MINATLHRQLSSSICSSKRIRGGIWMGSYKDLRRKSKIDTQCVRHLFLLAAMMAISIIDKIMQIIISYSTESVLIVKSSNTSLVRALQRQLFSNSIRYRDLTYYLPVR